jgi:hypothetical protein
MSEHGRMMKNASKLQFKSRENGWTSRWTMIFWEYAILRQTQKIAWNRGYFSGWMVIWMEDINGFFSWGMDVLDPSGTPSGSCNSQLMVGWWLLNYYISFPIMNDELISPWNMTGFVCLLQWRWRGQANGNEMCHPKTLQMISKMKYTIKKWLYESKWFRSWWSQVCNAKCDAFLDTCLDFRPPFFHPAAILVVMGTLWIHHLNLSSSSWSDLNDLWDFTHVELQVKPSLLSLFLCGYGSKLGTPIIGWLILN